MTDQFVAALERMSDSIMASSARLRSDVHRFARTQRAVNVVLCIIVVANCVLLVAVEKAVRQVRSAQKVSRANGNAIRDCTLPEGKCYRNNQRRTAEVIAQLDALNRASTRCGVQSTTVVAFDDCIAAAQKRHPIR